LQSQENSDFLLMMGRRESNLFHVVYVRMQIRYKKIAGLA
jgi:hypothetical protein